MRATKRLYVSSRSTLGSSTRWPGPCWSGRPLTRRRSWRSRDSPLRRHWRTRRSRFRTPTLARRRQTPIEPQDVGRTGTDKVAHMRSLVEEVTTRFSRSETVLPYASVEAQERTATVLQPDRYVPVHNRKGGSARLSNTA